MSRPILFLDDGGVINDNRLRGQQWQRLVGDFFAPRLGGTPDAWAEANRVVATSLLEPAAWLTRLRAAPDYDSFDRTYQLDWLGGMCRFLGMAMPPEEESLELAWQANRFIPSRISAAFPGAADAIQTLHTRGYLLHTASGETSSDLSGYLGAMGVRDCFCRLYGTNLVDTFKVGPEFYERIFADAGVAAAHALVVDDNPEALSWAMQVGARTVLVNDGSHSDVRTILRIAALADLPTVIDRIQ